VPLKRLLIRVNGIVQGVGFRPFVYRLAKELGLKGFVRNDTEGVTIEVEAEEWALQEFVKALQTKFPPLAIVQEIKVEELPLKGFSSFVIEKSKTTKKKSTFIPPDTAVCEECLKEFFDPSDRRYHYPFIVCTHCGPRFSIVKDLPYDRSNTSMNVFEMCEECRKEYEDPLNRRFHTQPTACPKCGPRLAFYDKNQTLISKDVDEIVKLVYELIKAGKILAIKGVGGFHLACDATCDEAVLELRKRKKRPFKPFALMMASVEKIEKFLKVSPIEKNLLTSKERPILLLSQKKDFVSKHVAPGLTCQGVMLPYTPFHHLLFATYPELILVMTSGNLSEEPICFKDEDAFEKLKDIADYFVTYDREIVSHSDDSVIFVVNQTPFFIRRSRGFVPAPFLIKRKVRKQVFAAGGDLKNVFGIAKENTVILSQYLGDLESPFTQKVFKDVVSHFFKIFDVSPEVFVCDLHPRYFTRKITEELAGESQVLKVQHHHAHIASVMAEHEEKGPVIGLAFDGTGFGLDGKIWGSEFLIVEGSTFERVGHFSYFKLPGGEKAIKEIWRIGKALLFESGLDMDLVKGENSQIEAIVKNMLEKDVSSPETCSIGRLFDGVAAILGIAKKVSTEAEAPQKLEEAALKSKKAPVIQPVIQKVESELVIEVTPIVKRLVELKEAGVKVEDLSLSFHKCIIQASFEVVLSLREKLKINKVVLSGGAFQNRIILKGIWESLKSAGFEVLLPRKVPLNDSGIALGQLYIAFQSLYL